MAAHIPPTLLATPKASKVVRIRSPPRVMFLTVVCLLAEPDVVQGTPFPLLRGNETSAPPPEELNASHFGAIVINMEKFLPHAAKVLRMLKEVASLDFDRIDCAPRDDKAFGSFMGKLGYKQSKRGDGTFVYNKWRKFDIQPCPRDTKSHCEGIHRLLHGAAPNPTAIKPMGHFDSNRDVPMMQWLSPSDDTEITATNMEPVPMDSAGSFDMEDNVTEDIISLLTEE